MNLWACVSAFTLAQRAHSKREELLSLFAKDFANSSEAAVNRGEMGGGGRNVRREEHAPPRL
jgi:hypothetical protein